MVKSLLVFLLLFPIACAPIKESWSPSYKRRHTPGDDGRIVDKITVTLKAYPQSLVAPGPVVFTMYVTGNLDECTGIRWEIAGGDVSYGTDCSRAVSLRRYVKCLGSCRNSVIIFGSSNQVIGRGVVDVNVGGEAE